MHSETTADGTLELLTKFYPLSLGKSLVCDTYFEDSKFPLYHTEQQTSILFFTFCHVKLAVDFLCVKRIQKYIIFQTINIFEENL